MRTGPSAGAYHRRGGIPVRPARRRNAARSLRRRRFAARNGTSAHDVSHLSGQCRRSARRGRFSAVSEPRAEFGPRGAAWPVRGPDPRRFVAVASFMPRPSRCLQHVQALDVERQAHQVPLALDPAVGSLRQPLALRIHRTGPAGVASFSTIRPVAGCLSRSRVAACLPSRPGATYPSTPRCSRSVKSRSLQYPASASTVAGCASSVSSTVSSNTGNSPWSLAFAVRPVATTNWCSASTAICAL